MMSGVQVKQIVNQPAFVLSRAAARDMRISHIGFRLYVYLHTHQVGYLLTYAQIKREVGLGRDGIRSAIKNLTELGYLKVEQTRKPDNSFGPLAWQLLDPNASTGQETTPMTASPVTASPAAGESTPIDNKEIQVNKTKELFEVFWSEYPKKPGRTERKEDARKAFKSALTRAKFEDILAGVEAYKTRHNGYPLLAHNWLKNDGWEAQAGSQPKQDGFWGL
jgi:hypothetical protein